MIPWVQVYSNLPSHDKTVSFAETLGLKCSSVSPEAIATGMLVSLWSWAVQNRTDGDLSGVSARTIAKACQWEKAPDKLVQALQSCGWLDKDMHIHDWEEYSVRLMENEERQKEKTRKRVSEYRERKKQESGSGNSHVHTSNNSDISNENVTVTESYKAEPRNAPVTPCNAPTVPNLTIPYLALPVTQEDNNNPVSSRKSSDPKNSAPAQTPVRETDAANKTSVLADFETVRQAWNNLGLGQIGAIDPMTGRGAALQNRLEKYGRDFVLKAISAVKESAFLRGDNDKGWRASIDWLLDADHLAKAAEGGYADYSSMAKPEKPQQRGEQRAPSAAEMEHLQEMLARMGG